MTKFTDDEMLNLLEGIKRDEATINRLREALQAVLAWGTDETYERAKAACDTARALLGPNARLTAPDTAQRTDDER